MRLSNMPLFTLHLLLIHQAKVLDQTRHASSMEGNRLSTYLSPTIVLSTYLPTYLCIVYVSIPYAYIVHLSIPFVPSIFCQYARQRSWITLASIASSMKANHHQNRSTFSFSLLQVFQRENTLSFLKGLKEQYATGDKSR